MANYDLSSLRMIIGGGSAIPEALSESWRGAIGLPITQAWGMTETSPIVTEPGAELTEDQIIDFLRPRVARWWLPDEVRFIDAIPKTSTGKFSKKTLRERV